MLICFQQMMILFPSIPNQISFVLILILSPFIILLFLSFFYFLSFRQQILYPFMVTDQLGRFDVDAGVIGGGQTGK